MAPVSTMAARDVCGAARHGRRVFIAGVVRAVIDPPIRRGGAAAK
jgi:hypothetical protein